MYTNYEHGAWRRDDDAMTICSLNRNGFTLPPGFILKTGAPIERIDRTLSVWKVYPDGWGKLDQGSLHKIGEFTVMLRKGDEAKLTDSGDVHVKKAGRNDWSLYCVSFASRTPESRVDESLSKMAERYFPGDQKYCERYVKGMEFLTSLKEGLGTAATKAFWEAVFSK